MMELFKNKSGRYNGMTDAEFVSRAAAAARRLNDMVEAEKK